MTAAYRNRNRPSVNSQIQSSEERQSYTVTEEFTRSLDKPRASDSCCIA